MTVAFEHSGIRIIRSSDAGISIDAAHIDVRAERDSHRAAHISLSHAVGDSHKLLSCCDEARTAVAAYAVGIVVLRHCYSRSVVCECGVRA